MLTAANYGPKTEKLGWDGSWKWVKTVSLNPSTEGEDVARHTGEVIDDEPESG